MTDGVHDDIDFQPEDELGAVGAAKAKLSALKEELDTIKRERAEYLDGWQRCKADSINARSEAAKALDEAKYRERENIILSFLPILDSFDMAMQGTAWTTVDSTWRVGVESIRTQIEQVLIEYGVQSFGQVGDKFDPKLHEPIQEEQGGESQMIAKVFRRGYRTTRAIIRPAQVAVYA